MDAGLIPQISQLIAIGGRVHNTTQADARGHLRVNTADFVTWRTQCENFLSRFIGPDSAYLKSFLANTEYAGVDHVVRGIGILRGLIQDIESDRFRPPEPLPSQRTIDPVQICDGFHAFTSQLRTRRQGRDPVMVQDEYDVQYLAGALLRMFFADVRAEEATPSYAGKSSKIDFLLKREQTGFEAKMTRDGLGEKEVGSQLIEDIARYQKHSECRRLVCFVYDPEHRIQNRRGLEDDLSRREGEMDVVVVVRPS